MLIDVSRKPARILVAECPNAIVIRTMAIRGTADGLIHQAVDGQYSKHKTALQPNVTVPNDRVELIETLLPTPNIPHKGKGRHCKTDRAEHYTVTGYQDQMTKLSGIWRINFIFDPTQKKDYLLTLLDETTSTMLITVQIPPVPPEAELFGVATPLRRYLNRQMNQGIDGAEGLWGAILDDAF
jgi:hypothetical protein